MPAARVLILYNEPILPADHPDAISEYEILDTIKDVQKNLLDAGYQVTQLGVRHDPTVLINGLRKQQPDVVFNLYEGTADHGHSEAYVAGILQWLEVPFTGSPFETLCMARQKHLTKHLLRGAGLSTPDFFVLAGPPVPPCPLEWPVIVKPALQDASVGVDQGSVVTDQDSLEQRVAYLLERYGPPVLVEQFIYGREFSVGLVEAPDLRPLPISEITFVEKEGFWPIVTFDAKWNPESEDYKATPALYPAPVKPRLTERVNALAKRAFHLLGCRDYARVDFRVRPNGKPYILEVNPNPDFSPEAGLSGGLGSAGLSHPELTVQLVKNALARGGAVTRAYPEHRTSKR
jgi:D-alanine-D-alanine ligase